MSDGLADVLARLEPVVAVTPLSRRGQAPAFRLECAAGPARKARVFPDAAAARRVERLLRAPGARALPRPAFRHGRVLVTEFIDGVPVDQALAAAPGLTPALVSGAGALLARLHAGRRPPGPLLRVGFYRAALRRVLDLLRRRRLLGPAEIRCVLAFPVARRAPIVLSHGDLCAENLVLTPGRTLRAIDEERLALRPVGFELARSVARWPLDGPGEALLLAGYESAGGDAASYRDARGFWLASALATSIGYRLRVAPEAVGPALERLRALAVSAASARP